MTSAGNTSLRNYPESITSAISSVENSMLLLRQASHDETLPDNLRFNFWYLAFVINHYLKNIVSLVDSLNNNREACG